MFKKKGTSSLPEVTNNIDGTLATHAADCGRGKMSQLFRFVHCNPLQGNYRVELLHREIHVVITGNEFT